MEVKKITCIICPLGCEITVKGMNKVVKLIEGNQCKRGERYATDEFTNPKRILTTTVKAKNYHLPVISVRTNGPIPKELLFKCMDVLKKVEVEAPVHLGQVVVENILDTGVDVIATKK